MGDTDIPRFLHIVGVGYLQKIKHTGHRKKTHHAVFGSRHIKPLRRTTHQDDECHDQNKDQRKSSCLDIHKHAGGNQQELEGKQYIETRLGMTGL